MYLKKLIGKMRCSTMMVLYISYSTVFDMFGTLVKKLAVQNIIVPLILSFGAVELLVVDLLV